MTTAARRRRIRGLGDPRQPCIPHDARDLDSFRRWVLGESAPANVRLAYLNGDIWFEFTEDPLPTHGRLKGAVHATLAGLVQDGHLGQYYAGGVLVRPRTSRYLGTPLGSFVSYDSLRSGRVSRVAGTAPGVVELVGGPDLALEVVADNSVRRDAVDLFDAYWKAGVGEYWLIDARGDAPRLDVYRRGPKGFVATRRAADGWLKSLVFGRSFRLTQSTDEVGDPRYTLEVRP